jgi:hypothetical protein
MNEPSAIDPAMVAGLAEVPNPEFAPQRWRE